MLLLVLLTNIVKIGDKYFYKHFFLSFRHTMMIQQYVGSN